MKRHWIRWSCIPLVLAGLFASFETAGADAPPQRATGSVPPASLGMPLVSVVCSTPRNCVAIGTPSSGSTLDRIAVRTADGGGSWASTSALSGIKNLYALTCSSPRTCVVTGGNPLGNGERGAVLRTLDGGGSWSLAPALPKGVGRLVGISCPTKSFWHGGRGDDRNQQGDCGDLQRCWAELEHRGSPERRGTAELGDLYDPPIRASPKVKWKPPLVTPVGVAAPASLRPTTADPPGSSARLRLRAARPLASRTSPP